jgi:hypothetical protein
MKIGRTYGVETQWTDLKKLQQQNAVQTPGSNPRLPYFSWYNMPKREKYFK